MVDGFENVWSSSSKASSAFSGAIPAPIGTVPIRWPVFDCLLIKTIENSEKKEEEKYHALN